MSTVEIRPGASEHMESETTETNAETDKRSSSDPTATQSSQQHDQFTKELQPDKLAPSFSRTLVQRNSNVIKEWADASQINYFAVRPLDVIASATNALRRRSTLPSVERSIQAIENIINKDEMDALLEEFPLNVTSLLNEDNKWGCFYIFPELYEDIFSPVVRIRELADVPELQEGVLTRDMVTACLSYLRHTPILGDYVYIKLDLCSKRLVNIDVLKGYKYLVYLDLSSNYLTDLTVLSSLPYLQYLSVSFNNLTSVLEYEPPQWFLSEVHYKFNSVKKINDLTAFWSLTVLNLSHNNIKCITGLQNLRYLRRLDLSFNHIQRLENLNHLRLLWLDVSYNNISQFEISDEGGLWTLLHLEYLNLNDNNLTSLKMFSGCNRLRELHARNNRFGNLLELAVYTSQMRRLVILDLRANSICSVPGYKDVVINTFPILISLDAEELDPVAQRTLKREMFPDVEVYATRRLLRLLYIQQLSRANVSPFVPPADSTDVPIVVIVGAEGIGKGTLIRRLALECSSNIEMGRQHTTADFYYGEKYIEVNRKQFDRLLLDGELLTYSERNGESYGLTREEAHVKDGKVKVVSMDLAGALMLKLRGYRPYLILATMLDKRELLTRQFARRMQRELLTKKRLSVEAPTEQSTLQVLLSGQYIIRGLLNELILDLPDEQENNDFVIESECSLLMDSDVRKADDDYYVKDPNVIALLTASNLSLELNKSSAGDKATQEEPSLYSLFKESQASDYQSYTGQSSYQSKRNSVRSSKGKPSCFSQRRSGIESGKQGSHSTTRPDGSKISGSKSVTFTWQENAAISSLDPTGLLIEPQHQKPDTDMYRSISTRAPWVTPGDHAHNAPVDDSDLWLAFLTEARQRQASDVYNQSSDVHDIAPKLEEVSYCINSMRYNGALPSDPIEYVETLQTLTTTYLREDYDNFHRRNPGVFWDTVTMDNPNKAFKKVRAIIQDIVDMQKTLQPMFDIDFANLSDYPTVEERLNNIREQIAPQQLFF